MSDQIKLKPRDSRDGRLRWRSVLQEHQGYEMCGWTRARSNFGTNLENCFSQRRAGENSGSRFSPFGELPNDDSQARLDKFQASSTPAYLNVSKAEDERFSFLKHPVTRLSVAEEVPHWVICSPSEPSFNHDTRPLLCIDETEQRWWFQCFSVHQHEGNTATGFDSGFQLRHGTMKGTWVDSRLQFPFKERRSKSCSGSRFWRLYFIAR